MSGLLLTRVRIMLGTRRLIALEALAIAPGEIVTLMGPSGCGKSTLLAWIGGALDTAFSAHGAVALNGRDITALPAHQRRIGVLFQDDLLFPHLSVAQNLAFGLRAGGDRAARVEAALADAELAGLGARDPATLSGGQRARIALLRTLLAEPEALLLDEPFGKLDVALRQRMRDFVFARARAASLPTLLVTHDPDDAAASGGRVLTLAEDGAVTFA
jgi:putative thiamine transport system ATP-binding protein